MAVAGDSAAVVVCAWEREWLVVTVQVNISLYHSGVTLFEVVSMIFVHYKHKIKNLCFGQKMYWKIFEGRPSP